MVVEKFPQFRHHDRIHPRVLATLALVQAAFAAVRLHAVKSFRLVEVEIVGRDFRLQTQKFLDSDHLRDGVLDQAVPVHDQDLISAEDFQPLQHVRVVDRYSDWPVLQKNFHDYQFYS